MVFWRIYHTIKYTVNSFIAGNIVYVFAGSWPQFPYREFRRVQYLGSEINVYTLLADSFAANFFLIYGALKIRHEGTFSRTGTGKERHGESNTFKVVKLNTKILKY
jgi:hypothetical protein